MQPFEIENPFIWAKHVVQFPHVSFLVHQVLGIVGSQMEIKQIFNVVGVITNLRWSRHDIENLDWLILIIDNWLSDVRVGCDGPLKPKAMAEILEMGLCYDWKTQHIDWRTRLLWRRFKLWFLQIQGLFHLQFVFIFENIFLVQENF